MLAISLPFLSSPQPLRQNQHVQAPTTSTLIRPSTFGNGEPSRNSPVEDSVCYVPKDLQYHPQGYPKLAAFINSGENFIMCRRYAYLHTQVMLYLQDELRELEEELLDFDANDAELDWRALYSRVHDDGRKGQKRKALIYRINEKLKEYDDAVIRLRRMAQLPMATKQNSQSFSAYLTNNDPLVMDEHSLLVELYLDMVELINSNHQDWFRGLIEDILVALPFPFIGGIFSGPIKRSQGSSVQIFLPERVCRLTKFIIVFSVVGLFVAPIVALSFSNDRIGVKIALVVSFMLLFMALLGTFTVTKSHEVFVAMAGYPHNLSVSNEISLAVNYL